MHEVSFEETIELIRAKDPRYARDGYQFVREALDYTQKTIGRENRSRLRSAVSSRGFGVPTDRSSSVG